MDAFSSSLAAAALVDGQHFTLPGYGTLEGVYVSARIDHVAREVQPPQLEVTWATPPVPGAQTLAELLVNTGATTAEAVGTQEAWISALERGRPLGIGDLGHLAPEGETGAAAEAGGVSWVPNPDGLRAAYWPGGPVAVEPLPPDRERVALALGASGAPASATERAARIVVHKKRSAAAGQALRYAAMFAVVLGAVALLWSVFGDGGQPTDEAVAVAISNDRLNRSPLDGGGAGGGVLADDFEEPVFDPALGPGGGDAPAMRAPDDAPVPGGTTEEPEGSPAPPPGPGFDPADLAGGAPATGAEDVLAVPAAAPPTADEGEEYVVILGSFGRAANAAKLTERLAASGRLPFVDQPGSLTRVGVAFTAATPREALARLKELRVEYDSPGAWLLE